MIENQKIEFRSKEETISNNLQSPHNPVRTYRQKGEQKVKNYRYGNRPEPDSITCNKTQKQQRRQVIHSNRKRQKVFWSKSNKGIKVAKENTQAPNQGTSETKQCGSDNFSFGLHTSQQTCQGTF
ncbi:MAG: hypothetical protein GX820_08200 [Bacteroidales bacterium]|nr:hypothetical protein [Bacteroidales bacterium]